MKNVYFTILLNPISFFYGRRIVNTSDCFVRQIFTGRGISWIEHFVLPRRENVKFPIFTFKSVKDIFNIF